jgi:ribonuclease HI
MAGDRAWTGAAEKGVIWRVGLGTKIQIWRDPWILRPPSRRITIKKGRSRIRWVSQLMIAGRREWDTQVLRTCFYNHDIKDICKIRLSDRMHEDVIAWHYEKSGIFSVKSAYILALEQDQELSGHPWSSTIVSGSRSLYKGIWTAQVPPKVRVFAWRLAQEGLATQCNRRQRKLTQSRTCQICGAGDEDGHHAVVQCTKARALRSELRGSWPLPDESQFKFGDPDWLILLLNLVSKEVGAYILLMFWRAWHLRNDVVHGKGTGSILGSMNFLTSYSESLQEGGRRKPGGADNKGKTKIADGAGRMKKCTATESAGDLMKDAWKPPANEWVKINTDAGFCTDSGNASMGVVIRDSSGKVPLAAWQMLWNCASAEEAEAEAFLRGIRLAAEWVKQPAMVEMDCANIIRALRSKAELRAPDQGILEEIRAACTLLPATKFQAIRREANKAARTLAQHAMHTKEFVVTRLETPSCIRKIVHLEAGAECDPGPSRQNPPSEDHCNVTDI